MKKGREDLLGEHAVSVKLSQSHVLSDFRTWDIKQIEIEMRLELYLSSLERYSEYHAD